MNNFLEGKKTYIGIIVVIIGWLGFGDLVTEDNVGLIVDNVIQLIGIIVTIYGRYKARV